MSTIENHQHDRTFFVNLLRNAENESRKKSQELENALLEEDPLGVNYARWCTDEEIQKSLTRISCDQSYAKKSGIPLLCKNGDVYVDDSDSHTVIIGASGSKKTRLVILPSILMLLKAGESMIITDPKAELYERTAQTLKNNGYQVKCINFRDGDLIDCWNPLSVPRRFFQEGRFDMAVGLLNDFSTIAVPRESRHADPFWNDSARAAFMGLLLLVFQLANNPDEINIRTLLCMRNVLFQRYGDLLSNIVRLAGPDSLVSTYLQSLVLMPEKTFASVVATLDTHLFKFIMRPDLTDMLCHNDIDFDKIGEEKTAIFLVMPDEKETYHSLVSLFVQQCYEALIFSAQQHKEKTLPRRVNFILDEFSSLPPIKEFPAMIAAARSRNIRFNIVVQSEKQLRSRYDYEADTIKSNCNNWIFLYSRELDVLEELCALCGKQKSGKPLISASRLQRLDKEKGEALVIHGRNYPYLSQLDDIDVYDGGEYPKIKSKHKTLSHIRMFHLKELLNQRGEAWVQARLTSTAKGAKLVSRADHQAPAGNYLQVQKMQIVGDRIYEATRKWAQSFFGSGIAEQTDYHAYFCHDISSRWKNISSRTQKNKVLLPEDLFPLNYLSVVMDINMESFALIGNDPTVLSDTSQMIYRRALASSQVIPILFQMKNLKTDWNRLTHDLTNTNLLTILIAQQLWNHQMPTFDGNGSAKFDDALMQDALMLWKAFSAESNGMPRFLLILDHIDDAQSHIDATMLLRQTMYLPNVRCFVTAQNPDLVMCHHLPNYVTNSPTATTSVMYFDDNTNDICVGLRPAPETCLEVIPC